MSPNAVGQQDALVIGHSVVPLRQDVGMADQPTSGGGDTPWKLDRHSLLDSVLPRAHDTLGLRCGVPVEPSRMVRLTAGVSRRSRRVGAEQLAATSDRYRRCRGSVRSTRLRHAATRRSARRRLARHGRHLERHGPSRDRQCVQHRDIRSRVPITSSTRPRGRVNLATLVQSHYGVLAHRRCSTVLAIESSQLRTTRLPGRRRREVFAACGTLTISQRQYDRLRRLLPANRYLFDLTPRTSRRPGRRRRCGRTGS